MTSKATKISCLKIKVIHLFRYFFLKFSLGDGSTTLTKYTFQIRKLDRYKFNANSYANSIEQLRLFIIECFKRSFDYSDDYLSVKDQMKIVNQNLSYLQSIHQKIYIANQSMLKLGKEFSKYFLRFRIKFTRFFLVKSFKTKKEKFDKLIVKQNNTKGSLKRGNFTYHHNSFFFNLLLDLSVDFTSPAKLLCTSKQERKSCLPVLSYDKISKDEFISSKFENLILKLD